MSGVLVEASGLTLRFARPGWIRRAASVQAVTDFSLTVARGEIVGLVGESGSGKSSIGRLLLGLLTPSAGQVRFDGQVLGEQAPGAMASLRRRMQLVFQDPYSSLDPRRRIGSQVADGLVIHGIGDRQDRVAALLDEVGLSAEQAGRYPHEFSGGQRQRIGIARALATEPEFLVADEPVSALDVSVQAQVLALLADLRVRRGLAMLFISHDLATVRHMCDRVVVLYLGRVMEEGPTARIFTAPRHPYTIALLSATPSLTVAGRRRRIVLPGEPPSPATPPTGCVFHTRCQHVLSICKTDVPTLRRHDGRMVACLRDDVGGRQKKARLPRP